MNIKTQVMIRNDPNLYNFLREYSFWYKELNRNPFSIKYMKEDMKKVYKLNPSDKIEKLGERMQMINTFIDLLN